MKALQKNSTSSACPIYTARHIHKPWQACAPLPCPYPNISDGNTVVVLCERKRKGSSSPPPSSTRSLFVCSVSPLEYQLLSGYRLRSFVRILFTLLFTSQHFDRSQHHPPYRSHRSRPRSGAGRPSRTPSSPGPRGRQPAGPSRATCSGAAARVMLWLWFRYEGARLRGRLDR